MKIGIACLYCDFRDQESQTLTNILGSLLEQFLGMLPQAPREVIEILESIQKQNKKLDTRSALIMLNHTLKHFQCTFVCIDGLDELKHETRAEVLDVLRAELSAISRLFLTGRPHIQDEVGRRLRIAQEGAIEIVASLDDIQGYLNHQIEKDRNPYAMNEQLKAEILSTIKEKSKGM